MKNHPASPAAGELIRAHPGWAIRYDEALHVWTAERAEGTATRFIVAPSASELAAKLEAAEQAQP